MPADAAATHRSRSDGGEFRWDLPARYNAAVDVCDRHAGHDAPALVHWTPAGITRLTFDELKAASDGLASKLAEQEVTVGDRVAVLLPSGPHAIVAALGILKLGAILVPLSWGADLDTVEEQLRAVGPTAMVYDGSRAPELSALMDRYAVSVRVASDAGSSWRTWAQWRSASISPADTSADAPALVCFTSGSTGRPKAVVLAHRFVLGALPAFELLTEQGPREDDVFFASLGWNGLGGLRPIIFPAWHHGRPVVSTESSVAMDPVALLELIASEHVTCAHIMPGILTRLRNVGVQQRLPDTPDLRAVYYAGEPLGPELHAWLEQQLDIAINPYYGATEIAMIAAGCHVRYEHRPGSVGRVVPGHRVVIVDEAHGEPVPPGVDGVIAVSQDDPCLCLGYLDTELAQTAFVGDRFLINDIGHVDADGYLWYAGRKGEVIYDADGRAVPATMIEDAAAKAPGVTDLAAVQVERDGDREVVLFVVVDPELEGDDVATAVRLACRKELRPSLVPDDVRTLSALPRTIGTGKIRRSELRRLAAVTREEPPATAGTTQG